jgi:hypothetical protein
MKMKTMMIATAARQRPMNRSSRAVKSRSAMVPLPSDPVPQSYNGRAWQKSHTARIIAGSGGNYPDPNCGHHRSGPEVWPKCMGDKSLSP